MIFLCIPAYTSDAAAAVNPNGIEMLLANAISTVFIKCKPVIVQEVYLKILVVALFETAEFLKILYYLMNYSEKVSKALKLVYQLLILYVEN